jgi:hypothetical protein
MRELSPTQIDVEQRPAMNKDVPEVHFDPFTGPDLTFGDLRIGEEVLNHPCGRIALSVCGVAELHSSAVRRLTIPRGLYCLSQSQEVCLRHSEEYCKMRSPMRRQCAMRASPCGERSWSPTQLSCAPDERPIPCPRQHSVQAQQDPSSARAGKGCVDATPPDETSYVSAVSPVLPSAPEHERTFCSGNARLSTSGAQGTTN